MNSTENDKRRFRRQYGIHLTSKEMFKEFIFPHIKDKLNQFLWVDLFAGEGNLILPILEEFYQDQRISFFKDHIFLFDIHQEMVHKCIDNAISYGIPEDIAQNNIMVRDNLLNFPESLKKRGKFPIYHITNPPYLYLGYITKNDDTKDYLKYFQEKNEGYQDLYQIAMMNDLRNEIQNVIYIIPSNFLFGSSVSNKFRMDFLREYQIIKMIIFETQVFEFTGTNTCIGLFSKKQIPSTNIQDFTGIKIKKKDVILNRNFILKPKYKYRAGSLFDEFIENYRRKNPLKVKYYLTQDEVKQNNGSCRVEVIDANKYEHHEYKKLNIDVNKELKNKIKSNILYTKTVDSGSEDGRAGLGIIQDDFNVSGIYVSGNTYRTHPIHIFLYPQLSISHQKLLREYFNSLLEHFRYTLDSEFLTTYKYSNANYTRKYLGLTQVRGLIRTFPHDLDNNGITSLQELVTKKKIEEIIRFLKRFNS
ncbi:MAG: N-6 DNA methylase [Promethearchaeota archaeon]